MLLALPALSAAAGHCPFMDEGLQLAMERSLIEQSKEDRSSFYVVGSGMLDKVCTKLLLSFACP